MLFRLYISVIFLIFVSSSVIIHDRRLSVVFQETEWSDDISVIRCLSGNLEAIKAKQTQKGLEQSWQKIEAPGDGYCRSNPVSLKSSDNITVLVVQDTSGQIFISILQKSNVKWSKVGGTLDFEKDAVVEGSDNVQIQYFQKSFYIFARTITTSSRLYWSSVNYNLNSTEWQLLGGNSAKLMTDVSVGYNSFTKLMEAFIIATDGFLYRSWQLSFDKWSFWDKTGYNAPKSIHAPVVHSMGTNIFNGRLNVFVHGTDGTLHHIWQTTCDKVPNPWGWCTWSTWSKVSNNIPSNPNYPSNSLSIVNNIHLGIELFAVDGKGTLWKTWQMERHTSYSDWQQVKGDYNMASLPTVINDKSGWWSAYGMDALGNLIAVQQNRNFNVSPSSVKSSDQLIISWNMPVDEASNKDWIGVYKKDGENEAYLDYVYVSGSQNPTSDVVAKGSVSFFTYLPAGSYDVRYLVDRRFVAATGTQLTITEGPQKEEWILVFEGIFTGLNISTVDVKSCVKDAKDIPEKLQASFTAFKNRAIYKGLTLFGLALGDVVKGMEDCGVEAVVTGRVKSFVNDLINCSEGKCAHFFIDTLNELLVLYENVYEIYGDIRGASNCFSVKAFAQGGVNIGRVMAACIELPR